MTIAGLDRGGQRDMVAAPGNGQMRHLLDTEFHPAQRLRAVFGDARGGFPDALGEEGVAAS
jgi:hypothetical protein